MEVLLTSEEMEIQLGESLCALRLHKNISQSELSKQAGLSLNAVRRLESGQGATVATLVRVLRSLGRQDWLKTLAPKVTVNPIAMSKLQSVRLRARKRKEKE